MVRGDSEGSWCIAKQDTSDPYQWRKFAMYVQVMYHNQKDWPEGESMRHGL